MGFYQFMERYDIPTVVLRLLLTAICSGIMGYEREKRNQAAGFRTYMIVSLASALVMMCNEYVSEIHGGDPVRLGAQVISGIGFLGAGTILVTRNQQVRGLTTAAGLWASAVVGLALGAGFYAGGIACFLLLYISMKFFARIDNRISRMPRILSVYCELSSRAAVGRLIRYIQSKGMRLSNLEVSSLSGEIHADVAVSFTLHTDGKKKLDDLLEEFYMLEDMSFVTQT